VDYLERVHEIKMRLFDLETGCLISGAPLQWPTPSIARREGVSDFVIPLHIDDLPYPDITIELTRVNSTAFDRYFRPLRAKKSQITS